MPTCRDIITLAARRAKIIRPGAQLKANEAEDGLSALQGLYELWVSNGLFGRLVDTIVEEDTTATPGQRIRVDGDYTIDLPWTTEDGGYTYPPYDLALIEIIYTDPETVRELQLYEAGRAAWVELQAVGLSDEAPLASRSRMGLADALAVYWAESFGEQVPSNVARGAAAFQMGLSLKYGGDVARTEAEYF